MVGENATASSTETQGIFSPLHGVYGADGVGIGPGEVTAPR